ncbi:hypothetical protein T310_0298 [Rasamsonia emersonii CBS 393.64]|uniref:Myb-like DNA-binding domain-containing protein n=1 Tax=Rasamsonia emersonii (strain ATCC 16479 / CBS 393.64 / IMI 116815) TaxID=1408163 RepID=A0A0F4Z724_RASE3|nr:hypothetical protein T310_0298 [Rasamsonia emersonii CBS 393.64]KKA25658.1 hypothetical protein T310_0298 [Rasamsonia emersonii CBS 393.64]
MEVKSLSHGVCGIDRRPVQIDFHAVSRVINVTPSAARRRFARLKKQIEKNSSDTATKTPAPEPASRGTEKTDSEATGSKQLQRPEYRMPQGAAQKNTQTQTLSCRVTGHSNNGSHPVHIDLTEDHDSGGDGGGLNADESSDDDAPLMKKRRIAGTSCVLGRTSNHERASVRSDDKNPDISSQTGEGHSNQALSPAQRTGTATGRERSNEEQHMTDNKVGIVGGVSVTAAQRTSEPQMVDLTGEEPPEGTSNANTAGASSVQASPVGNGADVDPASLSEQDVYLFGDELFDSFLGDLQNADMPDSYCYEATDWPHQASASTLELEPLAPRRESFMSIDEKPAYSWALRRLDQPNLAVIDHNSYC